MNTQLIVRQTIFNALGQAEIQYSSAYERFRDSLFTQWESLSDPDQYINGAVERVLHFTSYYRRILKEKYNAVEISENKEGQVFPKLVVVEFDSEIDKMLFLLEWE